MSNRFYSFRIVTYNTEDVVKSFIKSTSHYAYALHDNDVDDNGVLRSPHFHILCTFSSNKSFDSVRRLMGGEQNTFVQPMVDKFGDYLYLTHKNAPDKFQYDDCIIVTNSKEFFTPSVDKTISNDAFLNDILPSSVLSLRSLATKYGRDFIKNSRVYFDFGRRVFNQEFDIARGYPATCDLLSYADFYCDFCSYLSDFYFSHFPADIALMLCQNSQLKILSDKFLKNA